MKKVIFSLFAVALLASCADKNAYKITGTLSGRAETGDSTKVYLYADNSGNTALDSTILKDGKFTISGIQEKPVMAYLGVLVGGQFPMMLPVLLEPGNITIQMNDSIKVFGTPLNDQMKAQNDLLESKFTELGKMYQEGMASVTDEESQKALETKVEAGQKEIIEGMVAFIKENADNPLGAYFFVNIAYLLDIQQIKDIMAIMPDDVKADESFADLVKKVDAMEATDIGKKFVDVKGFTIDGKEASLSDYAGKGKVVLVDFWASWCGPCIKELPAVKKAYEAYKNKGFEIVGISLDGEHAAWQAATETHGIKWPQFSNLKAWDEPAAKAYGVSSIPHTVLLDKDGIIIEKNLRGEAIEKKLEELLR